MPNVYEQVKQALQDIVAPELREIRGEIKSLYTEIRRLDEKIDSLHNEMNIRFESVDEKFDAMDEKIDSLDTRLSEKIEINLEFRDRFAALEAKVNALSLSR